MHVVLNPRIDSFLAGRATRAEVALPVRCDDPASALLVFADWAMQALPGKSRDQSRMSASSVYRARRVHASIAAGAHL